MAFLPTPGEDNGTWGGILNTYLDVSFNEDGTLSETAVQTAMGTLEWAGGDLGGTGIAPTLAATSNVQSITQYFGLPIVNVVHFGADPTGSVDSTVAINFAIGSLPAGGGICFFPPGNYLVQGLQVGTGTSTTVSARQGVILKGCGAQAVGLGNQPTIGTTLTWNGASGGSMVTINGPLNTWGIEDISLYCIGSSTVAGYGLEVRAACHGRVKNLSIFYPETAGLWSNAYSTSGYTAVSSNSAWNNYEHLSVQLTGTHDFSKGILLDGSGDTTADTDLNHFLSTLIAVDPSGSNTTYGIYFKWCDSNLFDNLEFILYSGTCTNGTALSSTPTTLPLDGLATSFGFSASGGTAIVTHNNDPYSITYTGASGDNLTGVTCTASFTTNVGDQVTAGTTYALFYDYSTTGGAFLPGANVVRHTDFWNQASKIGNFGTPTFTQNNRVDMNNEVNVQLANPGVTNLAWNGSASSGTQGTTIATNPSIVSGTGFVANAYHPSLFSCQLNATSQTIFAAITEPGTETAHTLFNGTAAGGVLSFIVPANWTVTLTWSSAIANALVVPLVM